MAASAIGKVATKIIPQAAGKVAPKILEKGVKELAGKGGKEIAEHIFKSLGKGSVDAGKKAFTELAQKALKGDKNALTQLKDLGQSLMKAPGIGKDAAGLALKTLVNTTVGGGGDAVRKLFGLTGNAASALKAGDGLL